MNYLFDRNDLFYSDLTAETSTIPGQPSSSANSEPPAKKPKKLPKILNGTFYRIESETHGNIQAICTTCGEVKKGSIFSTGNFLTHYKNKHNSKLKDLKASLKNDDKTVTAKSNQPTLSDVVNVITPGKVCISIYL